MRLRYSSLTPAQGNRKGPSHDGLAPEPTQEKLVGALSDAIEKRARAREHYEALLTEMDNGPTLARREELGRLIPDAWLVVLAHASEIHRLKEGQAS